MNKKAEVNATRIFTGLVTLSMVAIGLFAFMGDTLSNYEEFGAPQVNSNENSTYGSFNILNDLGDASDDLTTKLNENPNRPNALQFFLLAPQAIWAAVVIIFKLPAFLINIAFISALNLQLPSWVMTGINAMVGFFIGMLILGALIKWRL